MKQINDENYSIMQQKINVLGYSSDQGQVSIFQH